MEWVTGVRFEDRLKDVISNLPINAASGVNGKNYYYYYVSWLIRSLSFNMWYA